jgi:PAS domain-containing protein
MDQRIFIAQLNIEHFRRRLDGNLDDAQRRLVEGLLAEEEAKLSSLSASIVEGILSSLLDLLASWASTLMNGHDHRAANVWRAELAAIFDQMPCAMSLIDGSGKVVLANVAMRGSVGEAIPSRDPERIERWRLFGPDGGVLDPAQWPGAKALRGETVNPGLAALHLGDDGRETALRIAAVPVVGFDGSIWGAIGAAYERSALERQDVHDLLERMLFDEQFRSRRHGREGRKS